MKPYNASILIVDDDEHVLITSQMILKQYFETIELLSSPKVLETRLRQKEFDVILLDMNFKAGSTSGNEGIFWLSRIQALAPHSQVILQTAYGDMDLAVRSMKEGAVDFLPKPWDKEKLVTAVVTASKLAGAKKEHAEVSSKQKALQDQLHYASETFIASAPSMQPVLFAIDQVASTDANVLILGENGTGKEVVARDIHNRSARAGGPFVTVDLGAVPVSLFESEMFGHEKGAFTDARESRIGKFELANKGTLFLDEVGNIPQELQVKLLSVLQNRRVTRIGSNHEIELDVRLISATNAPLQELVKNGTLRQDLFYRINTVSIYLPPLRERTEDLAELVIHYLEEYRKRYKKNVTVGQGLVRELAKYHWPGNIRELQHAVERAVILCTNPELSVSDFQLHQASHSYEKLTESLNLSQVEREVIRQALRKCNGNLTKTSEELGIGRTTLYRKMEEYGLSE